MMSGVAYAKNATFFSADLDLADQKYDEAKSELEKTIAELHDM